MIRFNTVTTSRNTTYEYAFDCSRREAQLNFYRYMGSRDSDTKLIRFGARDYDPTIGRWTTKDPIGFAGGDTNLYAYVGGNPMSYSDPTGNCPACIVGIGVFLYSSITDMIGQGAWEQQWVADVASFFVGGGIQGATLKNVSEITGYTRHGINQAIGRDGGAGVSPSTILSTVRNPTSVRPNPSGGTIFEGPNGRVVLNPKGEVITTIPYNTGAQRCPIK